jgi:lambda repressor-like predicted transcriptional regulator
MTAKEYLSQAWRVDKMITAKLEQVRTLQELAANASVTLSDMPSSGTRNVHRMEDIIAKIIDMKNEVQGDIGILVALRQDIVETVKRVDNPEYRMLLELRYLCFKPWDAIAADMQYSKQRVFQLHSAALEKITVPKKD